MVVFLSLRGLSSIWNLLQNQKNNQFCQTIIFSCDGNEVHLSQLRFMVLVDTSLEHLHSIITSIYGIIKALPSLIDPILTVLLIIELRKASKRRKNIGKEDCGKSDNTTKLVLFVTISFFILEVPNGFAHVTAGAFHGNPGILTISYMIQVFAEILPVFNSSSHIFICLAMSSQYRETSCEIFCGEKSKTQVVGIYQKIRYYVSNMITDH